jgi:hypothetical protein
MEMDVYLSVHRNNRFLCATRVKSERKIKFGKFQIVQHVETCMFSIIIQLTNRHVELINPFVEHGIKRCF